MYPVTYGLHRKNIFATTEGTIRQKKDVDDELLHKATLQAAHEREGQLDKLVAVWQRWTGWCPEGHGLP